MPTIKLIGVDLDGTLVVDAHKISQRNIQAVRAARQQGVTVAIATGRPHTSAEEFARRLGLHDVPIISFNGAMVRRLGQSAAILQAPIAPDMASDIVRYCIGNRYHMHYYLGDVMYVTRMSHWAHLYQSRTGVEPVHAGDMRRFDGQAPSKVLVCVAGDTAEDVLREGQQRYGDRLLVTRSMPEYIEFLSADAGKGKALAWLADHLDIPMEQTMGMGDMLNDLELVQMSGFGVAMAHAQEAVKQAARYVTQSGPEGVGEAIEKFVLREP